MQARLALHLTMPLERFFQLQPVSEGVIRGSYSYPIVALSYVIACLASYVALDITQRIRTEDEAQGFKIGWLLLGAIAMGLGIWTMHFIGMLAFIMPMPMHYDLTLTIISLFAAIIASGLAFYLVKNQSPFLVIGGIFMGLGIAAMHYIGMAAMMHVKITYWPGIFFLSILIALSASQAALWLMINTGKMGGGNHFLYKLGSALILGFAICGLHYSGMAAAVIHEIGPMSMHQRGFDVSKMSYIIGGTTVFIMGIALTASRFRLHAFQVKNLKLIETEKILEEKSKELGKLNDHLLQLAENSFRREDRIRTILTAAPDGIFLVDEKGIIEMCNKAATNILGYSDKELKSKNFDNFFGLAKNEKEFISLPFNQWIQNQNSLIESVGWNKSDKMIPLEISIAQSALKDHPTYIIVFRDISSRKKAEEDLASLNYQLFSTARLVGMAEVAAGVLHNVGNVLNSINISSQILLDRNERFNISGFIDLVHLISSQKEHLDQFIKNDPVGQLLPEYLTNLSDYLQSEATFFKNELEALNAKVQMIRGIIDMQRHLSGESKINEKIKLNDLIDEALLLHQSSIEKSRIRIEKRYADPPFIHIDRVNLIQILINLIKNAIETLNETKKADKVISISTSLSGAFCVIEIADNGEGIEEENLTKIFNYGFTTKPSGHGFGLHTSALSIQELGGRLRAFSEGVGKGALFRIELPMSGEKNE
ncbi:MAG: PAS domain S-box protein [Parachlamydia sp.]|nr:PAS domain S-box protein [Parachlamydia sp.]